MNIRNIFREHILLYETISGIGSLTISQDDLNEILKGYLEAALWTEEERLRDDYKQSIGYDEDDYTDDEDDNEIEQLIHKKQNLSRNPFQNFIRDDMEHDSMIQAYIDIKAFIKLAGEEAILEAINDNGRFKLGMDIWLTRNHHGAGFFDHSYEFEDNLTKAAHLIKGVDLYLTDNNTLAFSNA